MGAITYGKTNIVVPEYEVKEIMNLYNAGFSIKQIIRDHNYTDKKVRAVVHQTGITRKKGFRNISADEKKEIINKYNNGQNFNELAEEYGVSYGTIRTYLIDAGAFTPKRQDPIPKQQLEKFQDLIEEHIATRFAHPTLTQPTMIKCSDGRTYCDVTTPLMQAWEYGCSLKIKGDKKK